MLQKSEAGTTNRAPAGGDEERLARDPDLLRQAAGVLARQLDRDTVEDTAEAVPPGAAVDLYAGSPGVGLFWAAWARSAPKERSAALEKCRRALAPAAERIARWSARPEELDADGVGLGGVSGLGGAIYALTAAGVLLDDAELLARAGDAAALVTPERIARDRRFDVVDGAAGTILALLALARTLAARSAAGGPAPEELLAKADICAEHILAGRNAAPGGRRVWEAGGTPAASGFAHGAAGIAYALLRVHEHSRSPALLEAAREAILFERALYLPEAGNWRAFPEPAAAGRPMIAWCRGAPGIALGRIAGLRTLDGPEVRQEIREGLETTRRAPQTVEDHVCCGNLGRAMVLDYAAGALAGTDVLPRPEELRADASRIAYAVLRYAKGRGAFGWPQRPEAAAWRTSFFKGAPGAGYALLYLAAPAALPLPLLLEAPKEG